MEEKNPLAKISVISNQSAVYEQISQLKKFEHPTHRSKMSCWIYFCMVLSTLLFFVIIPYYFMLRPDMQKYEKERIQNWENYNQNLTQYNQTSTYNQTSN